MSTPTSCSVELPVDLKLLITELGVEALAVAVFLRTARLDLERVQVHPAEPGAHALGDELGSDVCRLRLLCLRVFERWCEIASKLYL